MKPIINTFTKQNVIEMLKLTPTIILLSVTIQVDGNINVKFGQILECQRCNILVVTQALVLCPICMPSALGPVALGLLAYISGKELVPMLQLYI